MSVNKAIIVGNLGSDPDLNYTQGGNPVCNFSVATNEKWTKDGQTQERTEWHRIVVWGKQAETCEKYLSKGRQVYVEGQIQTRDWEDRDGNKKQTTEIKAHTVQFLSDGGGKSNAGSSRSSDAPYPGGFDDNDIPF